MKGPQPFVGGPGKFHPDLGLEGVKRLQDPSVPGWGVDLLGQPPAYAQLSSGQRSALLGTPPTSVGLLKPGQCAIVRRVRISSSDSKYDPTGSRRVLNIAPGLRASNLFSLAASAPFSMCEQKEVQLLPLASLISFLYASLVALDKFHVLPYCLSWPI